MKEASEVIAYLLNVCAMKDVLIAQLQAQIKAQQPTEKQ